MPSVSVAAKGSPLEFFVMPILHAGFRGVLMSRCNSSKYLMLTFISGYYEYSFAIFGIRIFTSFN